MQLNKVQVQKHKSNYPEYLYYELNMDLSLLKL